MQILLGYKKRKPEKGVTPSCNKVLLTSTNSRLLQDENELLMKEMTGNNLQFYVSNWSEAGGCNGSIFPNSLRYECICIFPHPVSNLKSLESFNKHSRLILHLVDCSWVSSSIELIQLPLFYVMPVSGLIVQFTYSCC